MDIDLATDVYNILKDVDTMELARNGHGVLAGKISIVRGSAFALIQLYNITKENELYTDDFLD